MMYVCVMWGIMHIRHTGVSLDLYSSIRSDTIVSAYVYTHMYRFLMYTYVFIYTCSCITANM